MWSQRAAPALARSIASAIIGGVSLELDRREATMPGRKAQGFGWSSAVFCFPLKETTLSLSFLQSQSLSFPRERERERESCGSVRATAGCPLKRLF